MSGAFPEAPRRRVGGGLGPPAAPRQRAGIGRWAVLALAAAVTAILAATVTAVQLTERQTAEMLLARVSRSLFEIDAAAAAAWDDLAASAAAGGELQLSEFPLPLTLSAADLAGGRAGLADAIAAHSARMLYDEGFDALRAEQRGSTDFFSQASVFSGTVGRLTAGGRTLAAIALIVSLCAFAPLALGALAQGRGARRVLLLGAALGVGGLLAFAIGMAAEQRFLGLARGAADPLLAELYAIGADATALLLRNGGIIALLGAALAALSFIADQLERRS